MVINALKFGSRAYIYKLNFSDNFQHSNSNCSFMKNCEITTIFRQTTES